MDAKRQARIAWALLAVGFAAAAGSVIVNGVTWQCQNACKVTTLPNGGTMVMDSAGGWIRRVAARD